MEENFSPQQSLQLIQSMIAKTKANLSENRFYFLMWGWLAFFAIIVQFLLKVVFRYHYHYLIWFIVFPATIVTILYTVKKSKESRTRTYVGESMTYLWTGVGISFFILSFLISHSAQGWSYGYPYFILFYGLGTFVSGKILRFKPLVAGGIFNWALAIACVYFAFDYQLLIAAVAILTSYVIPGHLLKSEKN